MFTLDSITADGLQCLCVLANTTFHTISRAVFCTSDLNPHPSVHQYTLNFPASHSEILSQFREQLRAAKRVDASTTSLPEHNVVVLFDSINSMPGIMMPWKEMVKICKEEGAWSIVDAAHSLGQELDIDLSAVDPDFWISVSYTPSPPLSPYYCILYTFY